MLKNALGIAGIVLNALGTLSTLWTIFATKSNMVGTAWEFDHRPEQFPKEKRRVVIGFIGIVIGSLLQIASVCL